MSTPSESLADLQTRHKREQKDLLGRITQKKKNASKKTRKGVNSESDDLGRQLKERQDAEIAALTSSTAGTDGDVEEAEDEEDGDADEATDGEVTDITKAVKEVTFSEPEPDPDNDDQENTQPQQGGKKRNRAKERLARRAAETAAAIEAAKTEALSIPDVKAFEKEKIQAQVEARGMFEKQIRPDGHCLFSAVADQMGLIGRPVGGKEEYKTVRENAASYIQMHPEDFEAWMEEPLEGYVEKIRGTAEWGGHLELMALSRVYGVEICMLQDGDMQTISPIEDGAKKSGEEKEKIWLAYYRHGFGLGEHYNSLRKVKGP